MSGLPLPICGSWLANVVDFRHPVSMRGAPGSESYESGVHTSVLGWNWLYANQNDWWLAIGVSPSNSARNPPASQQAA